jgi:DNA-binding beta-propeller fold protein YncE
MIPVRAGLATLLASAMAVVCGIALAPAAAVRVASGNYRVIRTIPVGGVGGWDYAICDPQTHLIFVTRHSHTQVINPATGRVVADIKHTNGCHGVALVPAAGRGFISDVHGVTVFSLKNFKTLGAIAAGRGSDSIIYDSASGDVMVMNGRSRSVSFIPPSGPISSARAVNIPLSGRPEFAAADGQGHVYVNIASASKIAVIDDKTFKVIAQWKIGGGRSPAGAAIDPAHHELFVGCRNRVMAVIDTRTGKTIADIPIGSGNDACAYDAKTGEVFASCGDGTLTIARVRPDGKFTSQSIKTRRGARTMALDPVTDTAYLPDAVMQKIPNAGAAPGPRWRRYRMKPGSFEIIIVAGRTP